MTLNLQFLETSNKTDNVPDEFDGTLDCSSLAICCSFNRHGSLLAVGCNDGRIVIWDFLTRIIAKNIPAHAGHPVSSIGWSRNSHKLVSGSLDNSIAVWQVLTGECKVRWTFKAPILKIQFNPRMDNIILVNTVKHPAILLSIDYDQAKVDHKFLPTNDKEDADSSMVASFDRRGQHVYVGNAKGRIMVVKCPKKLEESHPFEIVSSFKVQPTGTAPAAIREIEFGARNKNYFLVNSSDRTIRLYSCEDALKAGINGSCEEIRKFQDMVNKTMWKRCCLSGDVDASHVCGGSARQHALYIWKTENGTIKKMLQGTKGEMLLDVQWHPLRPVVASISSGFVSIWARAEIENWSAYAPEFKEIEENEEYDERESEFDLEDEDNKREPEKRQLSDEDEIIDVQNVKPESYLMSSDEEDVDTTSLEFIPVSYEDYEIADASAQPH